MERNIKNAKRCKKIQKKLKNRQRGVVMATKKRENAKEKAINEEIERRKKIGLYEEKRELKKFNENEEFLFFCIVENILSELLYKYIVSTGTIKKPLFNFEINDLKEKIKMGVVDYYLIDKITGNKILIDKIIRMIELEGVKEIKKMDYNEELEEFYSGLRQKKRRLKKEGKMIKDVKKNDKREVKKMTKEQVRKLKWKMEDKGYTQVDLKDKIGICKASMWKKTNGISEFTQGEIKKLIDLLNMNGNEIKEIFF